VDASVVVAQVVGGFALGAVIGYILRTLGKVALLATGFALLPLVVFWHLGVFTVNWVAVSRLVGDFVMWISGQAESIEEGLAGAGVFGLSALTGFVFGLLSGFRHTIAHPEGTRFIKVKRFVRERS
jgi:uncharacterized membrane protein (Fun14 family)